MCGLINPQTATFKNSHLEFSYAFWACIYLQVECLLDNSSTNQLAVSQVTDWSKLAE